MVISSPSKNKAVLMDGSVFGLFSLPVYGDSDYFARGAKPVFL
jgi:hypothetical protein